MASKIIQKEKERQEEILKGCGNMEYFTEFNCDYDCRFWARTRRKSYICDKCKVKLMIHKQSLINLKEYLESEFLFKTGGALCFEGDGNCHCCSNNLTRIKINIKQLKEDIKALEEMIEKYG